MAVKKTTRKTKDDELFPEIEVESYATEEIRTPSVRTLPTKVVHIEPQEIIGSLNNAVAGVNAVFQLRDNLINEVGQLKEELGIAKDVRVEESKIESLKREQENFKYDYSLRKERLEKDLERLEEERRERIGKMEEDAKANLKTQSDDQTTKLKTQLAEHVLKLKTERDEHERKIKLEREDFDREKTLFAQERTAFEISVKSFEAEKEKIRERLALELNRDNEHHVKVAALNHQKEVEILRSELKLEQANRSKYEVMLTDSRVQNDKLGEQLSTLSREALASASSSSMAGKLKDIISQMTQTNPR